MDQTLSATFHKLNYPLRFCNSPYHYFISGHHPIRPFNVSGTTPAKGITLDTFRNQIWPGTLEAGTLAFKALTLAPEAGHFTPLIMYNTAVREEEMRRFFRNKYHDGHKVERARIFSDWENAVRKGKITLEKLQLK